MPIRALIIDDDRRLVELTERYLGENDVAVAHGRDGEEGLAMLARDTFDVVLLDIMMPGIDGLEVLRRIRQKDRTPVIMLTAKGDDTDRVVGLELGADDYLPKPFNPRELLARIRAVLRRGHAWQDERRLKIGPVEVDVDARDVLVEGSSVNLTGLEFDLLVALMRRPGRVIPRSTLMELAGRGDVHVSDRNVDVHISHLRKKLGDDGSSVIETVRGVGYVIGRRS